MKNIKTLTEYSESFIVSSNFRKGEAGHGISAAGQILLESIKGEIPLFQDYEEQVDKENQEEAERQIEAGLTSEINTSKTLVNLEETLRGVVMVLVRHPHGFKGDGSRDENGRIRKGKFQPFTDEENQAAELWAAGPKAGKEWATTGRLSTDCWKGGE